MNAMAFNTFSGCIVFLITNLSLLYAAHLLARRFLSDVPHAARLVAIGIVYYSFIIVVFQALSPFHAISRTWVTVCCMVIVLIAHLVWGKRRNVGADIGPIRAWIKDGLASKWACLIIACGFVIALSLSRALLMPPLTWDSLTYHLTLAALWIKKGTFLVFNAPHQMQNSYFPINGELFASWLLLPFHNDVLVNTMNFPITLLGGIACYAIARELGLSRKEASFAPALLCFAPMIYAQITTQYVDNAVFAFYAAAVLFTLRYLRRDLPHDGLLALAAAGILFGIKYNVIPAVGIVVAAVVVKTITLARPSGFVKKMCLVVLGIAIVFTLGGRRYVLNTIEARNPLYPFPVSIFNNYFEGRGALAEEEKWAVERMKSAKANKLTFWEREYQKLCQLPLAAGPKYLLFLIFALTAPFIRPTLVPKKCWYLLFMMWIIPLIILYTNSTAMIAQDPDGSVIESRYFSLYIALFTVQGLVVLKKIITHFKSFVFIIVAFIVWDLLYMNKVHLWEVEVLYPFLALMIPLAMLLLPLLTKMVKAASSQKRIPFISTKPPMGNRIILKRCSIYVLSFIVTVTGLYLLQNYRHATRYLYFRVHSDVHPFPTTLVDGWEFLDVPGEQKTIALAMGWLPPGTLWFFYPLMGRHLQNDITYVSAKYKGDEPAWRHRGLLEGNDFSIWMHNLNKNKVEYIMAVSNIWGESAPSIEMKWLLGNQADFQLVYADNSCKIFKYIGRTS
jgi:hypothetical protein